ncbi:MAG TPA: PH domain-containing protein [Solirubrobacteraceae bacterium]
MDLQPGEEIVFEGHPSWRAILGFYVLGIAAAVVVGLLVGIVADTGPGVVVVLAGLAVVLVVGLVKRIETRYVVTNQRLRIRRGVLSRRVQQTRLDRVQNVNTSQSLLDRVLGVGTVDFDTAGSDDSEFAFRGIASPDEVVAAVDRAVREAPPAP